MRTCNKSWEQADAVDRQQIDNNVDTSAMKLQRQCLFHMVVYLASKVPTAAGVMLAKRCLPERCELHNASLH